MHKCDMNQTGEINGKKENNANCFKAMEWN